MTRRTLALVLVAVLVAAACVRLGVWQLSRLAERRAVNATTRAGLRAAPVSLDALPADTGARHYRRVRVEGRPDYGREIVLVTRSRAGSPGVHLVTPVRVAGRDTAVLVNRGWVYSPDGTAIEAERWRDADTLAVDGWVELPSRRPGPARLVTTPRAYRWLDPVAVEREIGYPVTPYYVVLPPTPGETPAFDRPARLDFPALDEGPHKSYAVQWFSFALVALVGAGAFVRAERRQGGTGPRVPDVPVR